MYENVICHNCGNEFNSARIKNNRCPFCGFSLKLKHQRQNKKDSNQINHNVASYTIICHLKFSWSYQYETIDGKKRDITASSANELKDKVLERGFPWDDENVPEEKIVKYIPIPDEDQVHSMMGPQH